ncbi:alpha/beta fold hydrolase [Massilia sp. DWR3-1-1]|uniref:alpha/beta fold hydrolase n=1 Tax=Massilia sp. DWR3-1-1 TaxID=2804559 RepID=UPI003CF6E220
MLLEVQGHSAYCYGGGKPFNASLPSAVFIHGAQNDHSVWALQSRYFAHHGWNVLAVDLPGHGRSGGPALASVEAMAAWLVALLDAAGVGQALLIGHSMGSLIALEACQQLAGRVIGLAMLGTTYPMKVADALLGMARDDEGSAIDLVNIWSHARAGLLQPQNPLAPLAGVSTMGVARRLMQRMSARNPAQLFHTDFCACNAYANGERAIASLACPVLFIFGSKDSMTPPRSTRALTASVAAVTTMRVLQLDAGHSLMAEQSGTVLDALFGFAGELKTS